MVYAFNLTYSSNLNQDEKPSQTIHRLAECNNGKWGYDHEYDVTFESLDDARNFQSDLNKTLSCTMECVNEDGKEEWNASAADSIDISALSAKDAQDLIQRLTRKLNEEGSLCDRPHMRDIIEGIKNSGWRTDLKYPEDEAVRLVEWLQEGNAFQFDQSIGDNNKPKPRLWSVPRLRQVTSFSRESGNGGYTWYILRYERYWILVEQCYQDKDDSFDESEVGIRGYVSIQFGRLVRECMSELGVQTMFDTLDCEMHLAPCWVHHE